MTEIIDPFVTTNWLADHLGDPDLRIVDASWYLPNQNRDGHAEFLAAHISGAVYFDIDEIADKSSGLPHMLLTQDAFAAAVADLGISNTNTIVCYDSVGLFSAARAWWNFRLMGAAKTFVLDGGMPQWRAEDRPTIDGDPILSPSSFIPQFDSAWIIDADTLSRGLAARDRQIVDVRPAERFRGDVPEPRPHLRGGHIPGSRNLPYAHLLDNGHLRPAAELRELLKNAGVDVEKPIVATCGSGVTAAILSIAIASLGHPPATIYDGSWAEWGGRHELPIATGGADET